MRRTTTGSTGHGEAPASKVPAISRKVGWAGRAMAPMPLPGDVKASAKVERGPPVLALGNVANAPIFVAKGRRSVAGHGISPRLPYTLYLLGAFQSLFGRTEGVGPHLHTSRALGRQGVVEGSHGIGHTRNARGTVGPGKAVKPCETEQTCRTRTVPGGIGGTHPPGTPGVG